MKIEESKWIKEVLNKIEVAKDNNIALNLGSSTSYFREVAQPHIQNQVLAPLIKNGWNVINVDLKYSEGVDIVGDICSENFLQNVPSASLVICTNLLEHVKDISLVIKNLLGSVIHDGYILLTVPYKFRKHLDPIDNMFRPTPNEIVNLFPQGRIDLINKKIIIIKEKQYYLEKSKYPLWGRRRLFLYYVGFKQKVSGVLIRVR